MAKTGRTSILVPLSCVLLFCDLSFSSAMGDPPRRKREDSKIPETVFAFSYDTKTPSESSSNAFQSRLGLAEGEEDEERHFRYEKHLDNGVVIGAYGVKDTDGPNVKETHYVADTRGFRLITPGQNIEVFPSGKEKPTSFRYDPSEVFLGRKSSRRADGIEPRWYDRTTTTAKPAGDLITWYTTTRPPITHPSRTTTRKYHFYSIRPSIVVPTEKYPHSPIVENPYKIPDHYNSPTTAAPHKYYTATKAPHYTTTKTNHYTTTKRTPSNYHTSTKPPYYTSTEKPPSNYHTSTKTPYYASTEKTPSNYHTSTKTPYYTEKTPSNYHTSTKPPYYTSTEKTPSNHYYSTTETPPPKYYTASTKAPQKFYTTWYTTTRRPHPKVPGLFHPQANEVHKYPGPGADKYPATAEKHVQKYTSNTAEKYPSKEAHRYPANAHSSSDHDSYSTTPSSVYTTWRTTSRRPHPVIPGLTHDHGDHYSESPKQWYHSDGSPCYKQAKSSPHFSIRAGPVQASVLYNVASANLGRHGSSDIEAGFDLPSAKPETTYDDLEGFHLGAALPVSLSSATGGGPKTEAFKQSFNSREEVDDIPQPFSARHSSLFQRRFGAPYLSQPFYDVSPYNIFQQSIPWLRNYAPRTATYHQNRWSEDEEEHIHHHPIPSEPPPQPVAPPGWNDTFPFPFPHIPGQYPPFDPPLSTPKPWWTTTTPEPTSVRPDPWWTSSSNPPEDSWWSSSVPPSSDPWWTPSTSFRPPSSTQDATDPWWSTASTTTSSTTIDPWWTSTTPRPTTTTPWWTTTTTKPPTTSPSWGGPSSTASASSPSTWKPPSTVPWSSSTSGMTDVQPATPPKATSPQHPSWTTSTPISTPTWIINKPYSTTTTPHSYPGTVTSIGLPPGSPFPSQPSEFPIPQPGPGNPVVPAATPVRPPSGKPHHNDSSHHSPHHQPLHSQPYDPHQPPHSPYDPHQPPHSPYDPHQPPHSPHDPHHSSHSHHHQAGFYPTSSPRPKPSEPYAAVVIKVPQKEYEPIPTPSSHRKPTFQRYDPPQEAVKPVPKKAAPDFPFRRPPIRVNVDQDERPTIGHGSGPPPRPSYLKASALTAGPPPRYTNYGSILPSRESSFGYRTTVYSDGGYHESYHYQRPPTYEEPIVIRVGAGLPSHLGGHTYQSALPSANPRYPCYGFQCLNNRGRPPSFPPVTDYLSRDPVRDIIYHHDDSMPTPAAVLMNHLKYRDRHGKAIAKKQPDNGEIS